MTVVADLPYDEGIDLLCRTSLAVWTETRRGLVNEPFHDEWCKLAQTTGRLCVVAPREHAKSETFVVDQIAWRSIYWPGWWSYVFAATGDLADNLLDRVVAAVGQVAPRLVEGMIIDNKYEKVFENGSTINGAGALKAVRGAHPDLIVGDDVLDDKTTQTALQRRYMHRWWFGTVAGMAHPWTERIVGGKRLLFPPTQIHLVGTPFHGQDLLLSMRTNPVYSFYRYAAEFETLVPGRWAVEVAA